MPPPDKKYIQNVYAALKDNLDGFNKSPEEFEKSVYSDGDYRRRVFTALKDNLDGFDKNEQDFDNAIGIVKTPLPSVDQQMPDMGIRPTGTFKVEQEQPISHELPASKGDVASLPGIPTEHKVKQKETAQASIKTAIDNSVKQKTEKLKKDGFPVDKTTEKFYRDQMTQMHDNGDLVVDKNQTGQPVLKKSVNPLKAMVNAVNDTYIEKIHNDILSGLTNKEKIEYLKVKPLLDEKYKSNEVSEGTAGKIATIAGENAGMIAEGSVGAMLMPEVTGAKAIGSFIAMATNTLAPNGYGGELQKTYHALVAQGVPEEQAMEQAHNAGLVGEATSLATGAALSTHIKPSAANALLKGITKSLGYEAPKMALVSGASTLVNDLAESGLGVKKRDGEILNDVIESAGHGAVMGAAFWIAQHPGKALSYLRPQAENVIASIPKATREAFIKEAERNELIPKGDGEKIEAKVQEFTKAKQPLENLDIPEENKAAIAGKILQKQKLQEELTTLSKHGEAFAPRIEELTNQIAGIEKEMAGMYRAKDVFNKEEDTVTGQKPGETIEQPKTETDAVPEQSAEPVGSYQGGDETTRGEESSSGVAEGNPEEPPGARIGQEEGATAEGTPVETVPKVEPIKEFVSKQGHTLKSENGKITVIAGKGKNAGKEVVPETRSKVILEAAEQYDFTQGKEAPPIDFEPANQEEYLRHVVKNSNSPVELASVYIGEEPVGKGLSTKERMIAEYGMGKVTETSYRSFADKNSQNNAKSRAYFNKKGSNIDTLAKEISDHYGVEISPEDVTKFIDRFPNGADAATAMRDSDAALAAKDRFSELTGLPLDAEIAEIAVKQQFAKLEKEVQDTAKQDYETREQLEAEYWKHFNETNGGAEDGAGAEAGEAEAAKTERHYEEIAGSKPTATGRVPVEPIIGGSPKQISHIIRDISQSLSQKLFFARPRRRKAIGTYAPGSTAIKIRFNGDLDSTAHELGHSLDDAFRIISDLKTTQNKALEAELKKFSKYGSEPTKSHPDPRMYRLGEGFAEWLRARVVNPAEAIRQAPELNRIYEAKVSDKFKKGIEQFSTDVRTWAGATGRDITLANIEWKPEEAKGVLQKMFVRSGEKGGYNITFVDRLAANFVNPLNAFEKAWEYTKKLQGVTDVLPEDDPTMLSRRLLSVDDKFGEFLSEGLRDSRDNPILDADGKAKNFKWLLEPLNNVDEASIKNDMQDTVAYMVAERTVELSTKFKREEVLTGIGGGVYRDIDVARKTLDEFKTGDPERLKRIEAAAERYRSFSDDILKYMVDKGRLSQEQYQAIQVNNVQYVALRRVLETEPEREIQVFKGTGGKLTSVAEPVKKIKGSTKTIANPYISLVDTMSKSIREADRNEVMRSFRDMLVSDRKMYEGKPEKLAEIGVKGADGDKNTVTIFIDGKPEKWIFQEDIYKALKGLENEGYKLPKILTLHTKVLRATVTKFPVFGLRNMIRDTPDRIIKSTDGSGLMDFFGDKQHWHDLARNGGLNAGFYVKDKMHYYGMIEQAMKEMTAKGVTILDGNVLKKAWRGYENILQKSETVNRVAEYRAALRTAKKKGMDDYNSRIYAAYKARDLMDFALMGHYMKVINQVVPFSNAAVQGLRSTYKSAKQNPAAFAARVGIYTVLPQVAFWVWNHRDEETAKQYEEMPEYQRDMFFNFKIGTNKWAAIPKPYELGLPAAAVDRTLSKAFKYNEKAFDGYAGEFVKTISPIDESALTNSFTPELEVMFNKSLFTGKHIIPEDEEPLDMSLRNTQYASRLGQAVQRVAGMDARKVDYWVKAHFSYLGDVAIKTSNIGDEEKQAFDATTSGLIKRTPAYNSKSVQDALDFIAKWDLGKTQEARHLKGMAHDYFNTKDDKEKERLADEMINFSKSMLALWEPIQKEGELKSQQKAEYRKQGAK